MSNIRSLQDQAAKAERLAMAMMDALTTERLLAFAQECRNQADTLSAPSRAEPSRHLPYSANQSLAGFD